MSVVPDFLTKRCSRCGKEISIAHPELWAYKHTCGKKTAYWCSWSCLRGTERDECDMKKLTLEDKKEAVRIALNGGNPLDYIRMCGIGNAAEAWRHIKNTLKERDPRTYEKLPKRVSIVRPLPVPDAEVPEKLAVTAEVPEIPKMPAVPAVKLYGPIKIQAEDVGAVEVETPETNKLKAAVIGKPETAGDIKRENRYTVTAIKYPEIGEFYYDWKFNCIDWRTPEGDEVSMSPTGWKLLMQDLKEILTVLGVEL